MRDVETLKGLRERLRAAKGYEPDLAAHLVCSAVAPAGSFVTIGPISETHRVCTGKNADGRDIIWEMWLDWCNHPPTVSTDAALCLVEQALPEASIEVTVGAHREGRRVSTAFIRLGDHDIGECWEAATGSLAVCAALCSALIAQAQEAPRHGE